MNFSAIFRFGLLIENKVVLIQLKPEEPSLYNQKFNKADSLGGFHYLDIDKRYLGIKGKQVEKMEF